MTPREAGTIARELRRKFARHQGLDEDPGDPVDVFGILRMLDLHLEEAPALSSPHTAAVIGELDRRRRIVRVADGFGARTRRFTIAHEVGHLLLHDGLLHHRDMPGSVLGMDVQRSPMEKEANEFAAELLMPERSFIAAYYQLFGRPLLLHELTDADVYRLGRLRTGHDVSRANLEAGGLQTLAQAAASLFDAVSGTPSLADAFEVTVSAAATRLQNLGLVARGSPSSRGRSPSFDSNADDRPAVGTSPSAQAQPKTTEQVGARPRNVVALLGEYAQQWSNRRSLKSRGWTVVDYDADDELEALRSDPPCAVLVHGSFWKRLSPAVRQDRLRLLLELSSFSVVRVELPFVPAEAALASDASQGEASGLGVGSVARVSSVNLVDADFLALQRVLKVREAANKIVVRTDAPLDDVTRELLTLVTVERTPDATPSVAVTKLPAGHSGSKNFVLCTLLSDEPVFAKTNDVRTLRAELQRTIACSAHVPEIAVPQFRSHGRVGVLLQPFISAAEKGTAAAPSLKDFFQKLPTSSNHADLFVGSILPALLRTLCRLATTRVDEAPRHLGSIVAAYEADRARGLDWVSGSIQSELVDQLAPEARDALLRCPAVAVVHGDAHLGNVLLKSGTEPVLVDFAHAGPGHPLADLVRIENGLWTALLRNAERSAAVKVVRTLVQEPRVDVEQLRRSTAGGFLLDLAVRSSVLIRDSCRAALSDSEQWFDEYQWMHGVVALLALRSRADHYLSHAVFDALAT